MKKIIIFIIAIAALTSCTIETSKNGDLDGFWHLERIDTVKTGGSLDMSQQLIFWSVQNKILAFQNKDTNDTFLWRFSYEGDSLKISTPYIDARYTDDPQDIPLSDPTQLKPFGANSLTESYYVEQLSSSKLVLNNSFLRLYFIKF